MRFHEVVLGQVPRWKKPFIPAAKLFGWEQTHLVVFSYFKDVCLWSLATSSCCKRQNLFKRVFAPEVAAFRKLVSFVFFKPNCVQAVFFSLTTDSTFGRKMFKAIAIKSTSNLNGETTGYLVPLCYGLLICRLKTWTQTQFRATAISCSAEMIDNRWILHAASVVFGSAV